MIMLAYVWHAICRCIAGMRGLAQGSRRPCAAHPAASHPAPETGIEYQGQTGLQSISAFLLKLHSMAVNVGTMLHVPGTTMRLESQIQIQEMALSTAVDLTESRQDCADGTCALR